jgi:hypothetical protein
MNITTRGMFGMEDLSEEYIMTLIRVKENNWPRATCAHSLTNPVVKRLSNQIIKDVQVRATTIYLVYTYWFMTILIIIFIVDDIGNGSVSSRKWPCRTRQLYSRLLCWICILESRSAPTRIATKQLVHDLG